VRLPSDRVDWEVELVVVIGRRAWQATEEEAWSHVAGLTVGQDLSERPCSWSGRCRSSPSASPTPVRADRPAIVTPDELADPDDLSLICALDEELLQKGRTGTWCSRCPS